MSGYVHEGHCVNNQNKSHAMSHIAWAYHLYLVAAGVLPAAQGVMYKNFTSLISLCFSLIEAKTSAVII